MNWRGSTHPQPPNNSNPAVSYPSESSNGLLPDADTDWLFVALNSLTEYEWIFIQLNRLMVVIDDKVIFKVKTRKLAIADNLTTLALYSKNSNAARFNLSLVARVMRSK